MVGRVLHVCIGLFLETCLALACKWMSSPTDQANAKPVAQAGEPLPIELFVPDNRPQRVVGIADYIAIREGMSYLSLLQFLGRPSGVEFSCPGVCLDKPLVASWGNRAVMLHVHFDSNARVSGKSFRMQIGSWSWLVEHDFSEIPVRPVTVEALRSVR